MRLLYVANPNTIHVQRWVRYFADAGHDVHLAIVNRLQVESARFGRTAIHDLSGIHYGTPLRYGIEIRRLRRLLLTLRPDVLHAHYVARYGWLAACTRFQPLVVTAWGGDVLPAQGAFRGPMRRLLTPATLRRAAAITVDAPDVREICRAHARTTTPIETIVFGADLTLFRPGPAAPALRDRLQLSDDAMVVVSPRIFAPLYNIDVIVKSIEHVRRDHPNVVYVLQNYTTLGDAQYEGTIRDLVRTSGVGESVRFVGELSHPEMADLYRLADVVVSVPSSDGVPATFFEAMGCKAALVVSDLPAYDGLIDDGRTGIRVASIDPVTVAGATSRLLSNDELRRTIADRAHQLVQERGNFHREMSRVEALYARLSHRRAA